MKKGIALRVAIVSLLFLFCTANATIEAKLFHDQLAQKETERKVVKPDSVHNFVENLLIEVKKLSL